MISILLVFGMKMSGQIVFEKLYDSASVSGPCATNQLMMIKFEVSGERYVRINRCGKTINLYNLNHVLLKTINMAAVPTEPPPYDKTYDVLYLSERLFNTDSKMEYMVCVAVGATYTTMIYNEDGLQLFKENGVPGVKPNYHQQQYPVYNTSQGTKLILSYKNGDTKVFGLGGTLTTAIKRANEQITEEGSFSVSTPAPNPNSGSSRVNYVLPENSPEGEIVLYDLQGKVNKRF